MQMCLFFEKLVNISVLWYCFFTIQCGSNFYICRLDHAVFPFFEKQQDSTDGGGEIVLTYQ